MTKELGSLNQSIIKIRVELQKSNLKKTGKNKYAGFDYFELADFLPKLNELMLSEGINDNFTIENDEAILKLKKGEEIEVYKIPFKIFETPLTKDGKASMQDIQYLGALNTYYKRYLYLNAFGITDGEIIDSIDNTKIEKPKSKKETTKKSTESNKDKKSNIDYKVLLLDRLKELGINIPLYVKEHHLDANTTQEEAFILLEHINEEVKNGN